MIHILRVPEHEYSRRKVGDKWCFQCRRRLSHDLVVFIPDDPLSYYGPRWRFDCSRCHQDHTVFPGMEREYGFEEAS